MIISLIVAAAKNGAIGKNNQLLWHLPADLKYFKALTMGHPIIMGRKTFDSIGKPLPGRTSIIITQNKNFIAEGCIIAHSLEEAIDKAKITNTNEAFIIGGAQIFQHALPVADRIYLTHINDMLDGDTFFHIPENNHWELISEDKHLKDDKNSYNYTFSVYNRKILTNT